MILLPSEAGLTVRASRLAWEARSTALVAEDEKWSRASRIQIRELRDAEGHPFPLRDDLWLAVSPPRAGRRWRVEAEGMALGVVGRGKNPEEAARDWRKRMRATAQRFLEMRPFEMSDEDRGIWELLQAAIDIPRYRATKPITFRQVGKVVKLRGTLRVVRWEDGAQEKVKSLVFDEAFSRFLVGQTFEATVTRHPLTFRILRAEAVRKLPPATLTEEKSHAFWDRVVGQQGGALSGTGATKPDEQFWLAPPG